MRANPVLFARFLLVFGLAMGGFHVYVWRRLVADVRPPRAVRRLALGIYGALIAVFLVGGMGGRLTADVPVWVRWTGNIWIGVLGLLVGVLLGLDAVRAIWRLTRRAAPPSPERRLFLARALAGTAASAGAALSAAGLYQGLRRVRVKRQEVRLAKLSAAADGYRIVQISDVHIGPTLGRDFLDGVVDEILGCRPDLICITGDLVDGSVEALDPLLQPLRRLQAPDGVFFVTGNHEYYAGANPWLAHLPKLGVQPLANGRVRLPHFELAGIHDLTAKDNPGVEAADLPKALAGRDERLPLVLLAHQPRHAEEALPAGVDLQLSGHTHGGQMFPMTLLIGLAQPFVSGLYRQGNFQIYVSPGTGYWGPPMRLGTEAEVTLLTLRAAAA